MGDNRLPRLRAAMSGGWPPGSESAHSAPLTAAEKASHVVTAAVWAPSVHTTQPWRFTASGQLLSVHADTGRQLAVADPGGREMMISCGVALFTASCCGGAAVLHTQPLELSWLRESIRTQLSDGAYPQMMLRFWTVTQAAVSGRRPPGDVPSASCAENAGLSHE